MNKCTIVLLDDHPIVLAGLTDLIGQMGKFDVLATGRDAADAVALWREKRPDLIMMDLHMEGDVLQAIATISTGADAVPVIVFTASDSVDDCTAALAHGAQGYVVKGASGNEIFQALDVVAAGRDYVSSDLAARMVREMRCPARRNEDDIRLSFREEQIVSQLMHGASNKVIAEKLRLSEKTVKYYMTQIMQKYEVENRLQVVIAAQSRARV